MRTERQSLCERQLCLEALYSVCICALSCDSVCFSLRCMKELRCFPACVFSECVVESRGREKRMLSHVLTSLIYYTLHALSLCVCVCVSNSLHPFILCINSSVCNHRETNVKLYYPK